jgi:hypothetical protein
MVPVIAWAVISKSGYALANLAGTVTRGVDSLSSKMGSELTDGNMSFDNQSFHHRSVAGYQVAQQQFAPNFSFGSKYDDGSMSVTWDTKGGSNIQETLTNLGTHVALTDNLSASMTESGEKSLQASHNYSRMSSESLNQGLQKLYSYGDQFTRGHGVNHKFGSSQDVSEGQEWKATMDLAHKFALDNRISDQESFQVLAEAGVDTGALKFVGIKAGINTQARHDSSTSALIDEAKSSGLAEQFGKHLTSAYKHAAGTDGSLSDQSQKSVLDSVQGNFQKAKMYQEQSQASLTRSENYRKAAAIIQSMGGTITTNLDKQILKDIADKSFNGNETQAYNWYVQNPEAYRQHAADFITKKIQPFMDMLNENHPMSEGKIRGALNEYFGKVLNTVGDSDINTARGIAMKNEMGEKNKQKMGADFNALKKETDSHMKQPEATLDGRKGHIENEYQRLKTSYDDKKAKGIMMPNVEKIPAIGNIGNEISKPDDFGTPTSSYQTMNNPSVSQPSSITIEKPSSTKGGASITSIYSPARPQETSLPHNTSSGDRVSSGTGEQPSFSSQTVQNKRENTSMKGTTHESPSFREATPGVKVDTQPSYVQIESDIRQHNAQNKLTHQENQIRKLKDSIELSKAQSSSEDEPFEIVSSQTMDKW